MNTPKITLDTNCIINLIDETSKSRTSINFIEEIIQYSHSNKIDLAITTKVEADLKNDKNKERKDNVMSYIKSFPIVGTMSKDTKDLFTELQQIIFPGGITQNQKHCSNKTNDINHLIGHHINERDIFVTDDGGLLKKKERLKISPGIIIMSPKECVEYIKEYMNKITSKPLNTDDINQAYWSKSLKGQVSFDYSNNNSKYALGSGINLFVSRWSKASNTTIHAYNDDNTIEAIARVKGITNIDDLSDFKECDFKEYDFSSRSRTINVGEILILRNRNKIYATIQVLDIKDDSRGASKDLLTFKYEIFSTSKS